MGQRLDGAGLRMGADMTATNGWPGKPGVPPQDGIYWLKHNVVGDKQPCLYEKSRWYCCGSDIGLSPMRCAARYSYIGPVLTPDEVQNLRDDLASAERECAHQHGRADRNAAEYAREQAKREALQARVAELEGALSIARAMLVKAFNRVHCLPRSSDTELADKIEATLGAIRAAMEGKKDDA
jgi:hypothetical protein